MRGRRKIQHRAVDRGTRDSPSGKSCARNTLSTNTKRNFQQNPPAEDVRFIKRESTVVLSTRTGGRLYLTGGGCCRRRCGCCQSRHFRSNSKGVGHCTTECACCSDHRGFETTSEEKEEISRQLTDMLNSCNPAYLVKMREAYFSKLGQ